MEKISVKEAARRLGISLSAAYSLVYRELLSGHRAGRRIVVYGESVEEYRQRIEPFGPKNEPPAGEDSPPRA
jgi:excisionase family DNA binding protein